MQTKKNTLAKKFALAMPRRLRFSLERSLINAQIQSQDFDATVGQFFIFLVVIAPVASVLTLVISGQPLFALIALPAAFGVGLLVLRSMLFLLADRVANQIEVVLPDMLLLMAANLRAGMIPESSFLASIKPQFGKLNLLLNGAAIEVQSGKNFGEALIEMSQRTSSKFFKDAMRIVSEGLRAGGELHLILENLATNMLQNEALRDNMRSQVRSYSLFIFLASAIAAPLLYGVSSFLITILDSIGAGTGASSAQIPTGVLGFASSFSVPNVPANIIFMISIINVLIITIASSILTGILNYGEPRDGLRYIPVYVLLGLTIFIGVRSGVSIFFSSTLSGGGSGAGI